MLVSIFLLSGCADQKRTTPVQSTPVSKNEAKLKATIAELKEHYEAARFEKDRRAVCLRAIDEGAIYPGGSISTIDEIFGVHFGSQLPDKTEANRRRFVLFADQPSLPPRPDGKAVGVPDVGSYLEFDFDSNGIIHDYFLTNLHKGGSRRIDGKEPMPVAELKQLYESAKSEGERRDLALRAIDEGVIQTFGPVKIFTIDAIFGTHLASQLPTRKEGQRTGVVDFNSNEPRSVETAEHRGWFMAVEYYHDGNISNYYLTNIHR
jgi:hypothetical protein